MLLLPNEIGDLAEEIPSIHPEGHALFLYVRGDFEKLDMPI
jgi:hypothetical protein